MTAAIMLSAGLLLVFLRQPEQLGSGALMLVIENLQKHYGHIKALERSDLPDDAG